MEASNNEKSKIHRVPSSIHPEEGMMRTLHLFARALYYVMAPLSESIRSNAELLKGEESKIVTYTRLCHIAQQAMLIRKILEEVQQHSSLKVEQREGITMLYLEEPAVRKCLEGKSIWWDSQPNQMPMT